jgi:DNA-binding transcriptional MerR regulator
MLAQGQAGAVEAGLHHIRADLQDVRSLVGGKLLYVAEEQDGLVYVREPPDGLLYGLSKLVAEHQDIGEGGPVGNLKLPAAGVIAGGRYQLVQRDFLGRRKDALAALHQAGVAGDPKDPGPHVFRFAELREILEDLEQRVLGYFLGIFPLAAEEHSVLEQSGMECTCETVKRLRLAGERLARQCNFGFFVQQWHRDGTVTELTLHSIGGSRLTRPGYSPRMASVGLVRMTEDLLLEAAPQIPDKMYFRIGEASKLVGVPAYVLRFWEGEFPVVSPRKSGRGHRLYRRKDVQLFLEIKHLLYVRRFTIEGAKKSLRISSRQKERKPAARPDQAALFSSAPAGLAEIRKGLNEILKMLG